MKKRIDLVGVVLLLITLASLVAAMKGFGMSGGPTRGFFSGG